MADISPYITNNINKLEAEKNTPQNSLELWEMLGSYVIKTYGFDELISFPYKLGHISIDVTEICNQTCLFCEPRVNHVENKLRGKHITVEQFKIVLKKLRGYKSVTFCSHKGEPLVNKDMPDILALLKQHDPNIEIRVMSNGQTLIPKILEKIVDNVDIFTISIHAITEETNSLIIKHCNFQRILDNLEYLKNNRPEHLRFEFNFVGMTDNIHELPDVVRLAARVGAERVSLHPLSETRAIPDLEGHSLVRYPEKLKEIWREASKVAAELNVILETFDSYLMIIRGLHGATVEGARAKKDGTGKQFRTAKINYDDDASKNAASPIANRPTKQLNDKDADNTGKTAKVIPIIPINFEDLRDNRAADEQVRPAKGYTRYCIWPFYNAVSNFGGDIGPCCNPVMMQRETLNLYDETDILKSTDYFMDLKRNLLKGELNGACEPCSRRAIVERGKFMTEIARQYAHHKNIGTPRFDT